MTTGEALLYGLDMAGVSQALLAYKTGISTKHINQIIKGKCRLSVEVAVRIEMAVPSISAEGLLIDQIRQEIADYVEGRPDGRNAADHEEGSRPATSGSDQDLQQGIHRGSESGGSRAG